MKSAPALRATTLPHRLGIGVVVPLLLVGCAQLPQHTAIPPPIAAADLAHQVTVQDRRGPLSAGAERRVLAGVAAAGHAAAAERQLGVLAAQGEADLYRGNALRLLVDGPATFAAMTAAVEQAHVRVLLESYDIEDRDIGRQLAAQLARKAAQGVAVAVIYDSVGSISTAAGYFEGMRAAGVAVCAFNPVNPLVRPGYWGINHRDHRKVLVVDDAVVYTGGINISRVYSTGSFGHGRAVDPDQTGWRDTDVELRGPAVDAFVAAFGQTWRSQGCAGSLGRVPPIQTVDPGTRVVQVLASGPQDARSRIYTTLLDAIAASQSSVHLTMAYFAPGAEMVRALCDAAHRGVDVVLLLPSHTDFVLVLHAGQSYYADLLAAGVQIFELDSAVLHAKTAVIDGVLSTVGSSNMDWRSIVSNDEINVVVIGDDFAAQLEAIFQRDLARAQPVLRRTWPDRGVRRRLLEWFGRFAEPLL